MQQWLRLASEVTAVSQEPREVENQMGEEVLEDAVQTQLTRSRVTLVYSVEMTAITRAVLKLT